MLCRLVAAIEEGGKAYVHMHENRAQNPKVDD